MVQCLGRAKSGANPWLATSVCGKITDPQLSDILQKIKFWRSFFRFHQWDLGSFCNHVHRTGFDACAFDAEAFHKSLVRFDSRDRGAIVALAIGKHVTRNHLCKFARTIKDEFVLCAELLILSITGFSNAHISLIFEGSTPPCFNSWNRDVLPSGAMASWPPSGTGGASSWAL